MRALALAAALLLAAAASALAAPASPVPDLAQPQSLCSPYDVMCWVDRVECLALGLVNFLLTGEPIACQL